MQSQLPLFDLDHFLRRRAMAEATSGSLQLLWVLGFVSCLALAITAYAVRANKTLKGVPQSSTVAQEPTATRRRSKRSD
jgi:hypothetical protein